MLPGQSQNRAQQYRAQHKGERYPQIDCNELVAVGLGKAD